MAAETERWFPILGVARRPLRAKPSPTAPSVWNWFGPDPAARVGRTAFRPNRIDHLVALATTMLGLAVIVYGFYVAPLLLHFDPATTGAAASFDQSSVRSGLLENAFLLLGVPLVWVAVRYEQGARAWGSRLGLGLSHFGLKMGIGVIAGFGVLVLTMVTLLVYSLLAGPQTNAAAFELARSLTWTDVFLLAVVAGVTEEVFFRGWLQGRIGIVGANVLFGFAHLSYGTAAQVVVPLALGFAFSWLRVRYGSVWPGIVAHFVYNGVQLALAKTVIEQGLV